MSNEQHTPGPWFATPVRGVVGHVSSANVGINDGGDIATAWGVSGNAKADARLMAAAPDMLAMLKGLRRTIASMGADLEVAAPQSINANTYSDELGRINALIAKATGVAT